MNAKEEGIINTLKKLSESHDEMAKKAQKDNQYITALCATTIAMVTAEAAKIIAKQDAELTALRTQPVTGRNLSDIGRCIHVTGQEPQQYIILAELQGKYLITTYPIRESEILTNLRLAERTQVAFIDGEQRVVFNA